MGLNASIDLCFMRVGHTPCFVDGAFGLLKQTDRKSYVDTLQQLADETNKSAAFNKAVLFSSDWRQWDAYLFTVFKSVKNITKCQNFHLSADKPGMMEMSGSSTEADKALSMIKPEADISTLKTEVLPPDL